jgi:hypothetical protein
MSRTEKIDHPVDVARPFVCVAALFFSTGFLGYLALHALFVS